MEIVEKLRYSRQKLTKPFWENTKLSEANGCIEWMGDRYPQGYGRAHIALGEPRTVRAHRRAWEITNGEIPSGLDVLHRCDNPPCVNPAHLFLGTDKDNVQDMLTKGRGNKVNGLAHHKSKLTPEDVIRIREAHFFGARPIDLARAYGVSDTAIHYVVRRKNWGHLGRASSQS